MFHIRNQKKGLRINNEIMADEVRLIDSDGSMLGISSYKKAMELAFEKDLDLVEISPNGVPPVCKIADYNKMMYEKSKKEKEVKKSSRTVTLKEIRLSVKIDQHDLDVKSKSAYKFLTEGNKVKASIRFRGRQQKYAADGQKVLLAFADSLQEVGTMERPPVLEGRNMSMMLSPKTEPCRKNSNG